jgi:hypothetical protein
MTAARLLAAIINESRRVPQLGWVEDHKFNGATADDALFFEESIITSWRARLTVNVTRWTVRQLR